MFTVFDPNGITRSYTVRPSTQSREIYSIQAISSITDKGKTGQGQDIDPKRYLDRGQNNNLEHSIIPHKGANPYQKLDMEQAPRRILHAEDLMSSPVLTLDLKAMVRDAQNIFEDRRFRHVPVLNEESRIVGIVSDRDVLRQIASHGKVVETRTISSVMKTDVLSAHPATDIRTVAQVMFQEHIGALPIIDESFSLVGIVTRSDILRGLLKHGPIELWG